MGDWAAYDAVAGRYDAVWGERFSAVADLVWRRVGRIPHASVLDVGTGTGILPHALLARDHTVAIAAGCDRSIGMLEVARTRTPSLRAVAADGQMLPFRDAAFDAATASFVMSHMSDYPAALAEMRRVLRSWAASRSRPGPRGRMGPRRRGAGSWPSSCRRIEFSRLSHVSLPPWLNSRTRSASNGRSGRPDSQK
jgi:SAM-dependent methyltransferase